MTIGRTASVLAMFLAFLILPGLTQASVVAPGAVLPPDIFAPCPGCVLLATFTSGSITSTTGVLTFDVSAAVYSDPSNVFGAADLDFMYQIANSATSVDAVGRVTAIDFTGFLTDVGFTLTGSALPGGLFVDGSAAPKW